MSGGGSGGTAGFGAAGFGAAGFGAVGVALERERLFVALTRPQLFAGVTYSFFVINLVLSTEFFLIFRSIWALALALVAHVAGAVACLGEPRVFDLWLVWAARCPRVANYRFWRCNSYRA